MMSLRSLPYVAAVLAIGIASQAVAQNVKKVRVSNNTSDTGIRVRCVGFGEGVSFTLDVAKGAQVIQDNVFVGDRGVVVYEDFNKKIIVTGKFTLESTGQNIDISVTGNKTSGYTVGFAAAAFH
jgi:hypothetical protein